MDTKKLLQKILDLAIRGKLVPQDPNDEPASMLLERIRAEKERLIKEGKVKRSKNTTEDDKIEAPFEIPESWKWVRLEDMVSPDCTLGYGIVQPMEDVLNGIPVVRPVDLISPIIGIKGLKRIDEKISNSYQRTILKGGEILFCVRASVGKVGIASGQLRGANVTRGISPLRFDFEYLTKYVFYHLQSLFSQTEIKSYSRGATLQQINVEDLKLLLIAVPPLSEQKRIVDEIERWFTLIDELESNEDDLLMAIDKAKSKILDLAIHGKLVPQDPNDEPVSVLLNRIREEKKRLVKEGKLKKKDLEETPISEDEIPFDIPDSWEWHRIGFLSNLYTGNSISKEVKESKYTNVRGRCYIATKDVNFDNTIDYYNGVYIPENDEPLFKIAVANSILMCIEGGSAGRKIGIIDRDVCFGNKLCCFHSYGINNKYLYYYLQSSNFKEIFNNNKKGIIGGVSINMISPLVIPLPPLAEQKRIVAKIEEAFKAIDALS